LHGKFYLAHPVDLSSKGSNAQNLHHHRRQYRPGFPMRNRAECGPRQSTSKLCNIYTTYEFARHLAASTDQRLQSVRVNAFDPGMMPGTGLAQTYPPVIRFAWHYILPALALFQRNVNTPAKSGRRLAQLAAGSEGKNHWNIFLGWSRNTMVRRVIRKSEGAGAFEQKC